MLTILGLIAAGAGLLGGIMNAVSTAQASQAQQEEAVAQAELAESQAAQLTAQAQETAGQIRKETEWKIGDLQTQQRQFMGQQKVLIGRSGVKLSSGSPLALLTETSRRAGEDVRRMWQQGEWGAENVLAQASMESETLLAQAEIYRMQGQAYQRMRPWQVLGSLLGAVGSGATSLMPAFA